MAKKIICTACGSTDVQCEAWINPNTGKVDHYSDESFEYGLCLNCGEFVTLTDVHEEQELIDKEYLEYKDRTGKDPNFLLCGVCDRNGNVYKAVLIRIVPEHTPQDTPTNIPDNKNVIYSCYNIEELKRLCDFTDAPFIIDDVRYFL